MKTKRSKAIEEVATSSLIPFAKNAKKHDAAQVAAIAGSIREFGFNNPVLIDSDNGIIAGHGRVLAAHQLELETVPCLRLSHLTEAQKRAYIIADNRLAEIGGGWDAEMLQSELDALTDEGFSLESIGWEEEVMPKITKEDCEIKEINAYPPKVAWFLIRVPIEKTGDIQPLLDHLPLEAKTYSTYTDEKN